MLNWKEDPVRAMDRQIDIGRALQKVAMEKVKSMVDNRSVDAETLHHLALTVTEGCNIEQAAIHNKIDLAEKKAELHTDRTREMWCFDPDAS